MFVVSVMYPVDPQFDHDYYIQSHMPLVHARWDEFGLRDTTVLRGLSGPGGSLTYQVITLLRFDTQAAFEAAAGEHGAEIFADIPKFTQTQPILQFNASGE